jgi:hypothetical protein
MFSNKNVNKYKFIDLIKIYNFSFGDCSIGVRALFGCADKPAEKHCWLICCERKILFRLKKQAEKDGL